MKQAFTFASALVLVSLTTLSVIVGEMVPKTIALRYPTGTALMTTRPMLWSGRMYAWFIVILDRSAVVLRRLLRNLLENAALHGMPPTQVRVSRSPTAATITVWDGGHGVPPAEFENVFRPFYRPPDGSRRSGTGLGLSLVRQIARSHGGDARCGVMPDGRSSFLVTLPLDQTTTGYAPESPKLPDKKVLDGQ